ncbi:hypothetical protein QQZ08_010380 [Neonectria magnoliae]|uniref:Uncharacterized protein n=1 Tax=Neonectria magnoliae TaxID=2732573 RepID=A0ABR1HHH1_9HYPO
MRFSITFMSSTTTMITTALLLSFLIVQSMAISDSALTTTFAAPQNPLVRRAEDVGSACDSEGQWNCMTNSWQRCAGGLWSEEIQCAEGTTCTPSGHTTEFRVEYEGNGDGDGNGTSGSNGSSIGPKGTLSKATALATLGLWTVLAVVGGTC